MIGVLISSTALRRTHLDELRTHENSLTSTAEVPRAHSRRASFPKKAGPCSFLMDSTSCLCETTTPNSKAVPKGLFMMIRRGVMGALPSAMVLFLCVLLLGSLVTVAGADDKSTKIDPDAARPNYRQACRNPISPDRLSASHTRPSAASTITIAADPGQPAVDANSRMAGTPGADQARDYVKGELSKILGDGAVSQEDFPVSIPVDRGASIATADGKKYALQPLWPNLVRTSTLPEAGVSGQLIYAGRGDLRSFRGKNVSGSIVMMDFNCGTRWLNAPRLGAKAIIFVEPTATMRGEAESKFIGIPVSIPRFWISHEDAVALEGAALTSPQVNCTVQANQPWEVHTASNIVWRAARHPIP